MKSIKIIGLISSGILILNYLEVGLTGIIKLENETFHFLQNTVFRHIFLIGFIGFFYAIVKFLDHYKQIKARPYLYALIGIKIFVTITEIIVSYLNIEVSPMIYGSIIGILNISILILFIIAGIMILKVKIKLPSIQKLKTYVISSFAAYLLVFILNLIIIFFLKRSFDPEFDADGYINIANSIYTIPYFFGLLFFVSLNETPEVSTEEV